MRRREHQRGKGNETDERSIAFIPHPLEKYFLKQYTVMLQFSPLQSMSGRCARIGPPADWNWMSSYPLNLHHKGSTHFFHRETLKAMASHMLTKRSVRSMLYVIGICGVE